VPEIRRNLITGEWVVVAPERARRPQAQAASAPQEARPERRADCPFCPGNEGSTPGLTLSLGEPEWRVRAFPNRFSLLAPQGEPWRREEGRQLSTAAVGPHEVFCETRRHDLALARLPPDQVGDVVRAWHARATAFHADARVAWVSLFKNHGAAAGASQEHAHSQIVGLPMVPAASAERAARAERHHAETGRCLVCATLEDELAAGGRVVQETERFVSFIPWAALSPFHLWIFPRRHAASFALAEPAELAELGAHLQRLLRRVDLALHDPPFNLVVQSVPPGRAGSPALHWYLSVVPRIGRAAGFELGTAMYVNASLPEDCARQLREAT
jgi:UDPglucose--hexose-1-phosphate uridylyltransferase